MGASTNMLIVGTGSIGERHLRCFQHTGRADLSLCEVNRELRDRIAAKYGIARVYADLDAALADSYDAAVIATPAHLHVQMATQLAEAGTNLLIEKPLSTGLEGVDSLERALAQQNLVAVVAYVMRHQPALKAMREAIHSGRFGRPVQLVAVSGQHFPTYRPAYRDIYYADRATGGGAVQDALTHMLNAGQWLAGPIDRVAADTAHKVLDGVDVEDTVHVLARQGDLLGSYSLNQYQAPNELVITVVCEQGTCRFELHHQHWAWMTQPDTPWQVESAAALERDELFVAQANAFLDVVEGRATPSCTVQEAVQTLRTNLAILASDAEGTWKETCAV